ncbi:hypothetical protein A4X13_0g8881 [Tilletia indica]|uniref:Uncharacterized protein n=1 Tax=Tilletia indica TaxID=43049 RepID=A0A8T8SCI6_9BASI|nr:hypothetical protein A4X13_0g8881 [Tilletia indica]
MTDALISPAKDHVDQGKEEGSSEVKRSAPVAVDAMAVLAKKTASLNSTSNGDALLPSIPRRELISAETSGFDHERFIKRIDVQAFMRLLTTRVSRKPHINLIGSRCMACLDAPPVSRAPFCKPCASKYSSILQLLRLEKGPSPVSIGYVRGPNKNPMRKSPRKYSPALNEQLPLWESKPKKRPSRPVSSVRPPRTQNKSRRKPPASTAKPQPASTAKPQPASTAKPRPASTAKRTCVSDARTTSRSWYVGGTFCKACYNNARNKKLASTPHAKCVSCPRTSSRQWYNKGSTCATCYHKANHNKNELIPHSPCGTCSETRSREWYNHGSTCYSCYSKEYQKTYRKQKKTE